MSNEPPVTMRAGEAAAQVFDEYFQLTTASRTFLHEKSRVRHFGLSVYPVRPCGVQLRHRTKSELKIQQNLPGIARF